MLNCRGNRALEVGCCGPRRVGVLALAGAVVFAVLGGCPPSTATGAGLSALEAFMPSEAELNQYQRELAEFSARLEDQPSVAVRIVNNTAATARVVLSSGVEGPEPPMGEYDYALPETTFLTSVASATILVAANGTASGTLACGDVIGISATAPFDAQGEYAYGPLSEDAFGLYIEPGNVTLAGAGSASSGGFSGDTLAVTHFVRPATDNLTCATDTLVITIETPAAQSVYDPQTGALTAGATLGTGTISIE